MSKRFTIKYEYSTDGLTWIDFSDIVDSTQTKLTHNLCTQGFKSAKDSCTFTIPAVTSAVKNQLIEDLLGTDDLHFRMNIPAPVQVYWGDDKVQWDSNDVYWDGNTIGFVGYIDRSSVDLKSFPLPTSLTLTAYDVSFLHLDDKVDKYITLENKTITQIVHALLADAGYSYDASALDAGDEVTLQAFVIDKDNSKSYREYIDTLLFEAGGYVLDFTPGGFARIFHLPWDDANGPYRSISNPMNADGVQIKSAYLKEDGVRMKWSTLKWSDADRQIWRDSINRKLDGNNVMQGEEIAAGAYWPQNAEVTPSYMEYSADFLDDPYLKLDTRKKNEDLSIIMAKNIYAEIYAEQNGSQYVFPQPAGYPIPADFQAPPYNFITNPMLWPQKAWYLLYNSTASPINLTSFIIRGTVLYRDRINTLETDGSTNPKEYVSEYIYNNLQAQRFLDFYWHFLQTSRFTMTWSEPYLIEDLGDVVEIMQKGMTYTQDAVIVAKTIRFANDKTPIVQYSAVGVAVPVLSNGVAYSTVPQGSSAIPSQEELTVEQKIDDIESEVENWDFAIEQSAVPRNDRIPWHPNDPDSYTDIHLTSLQKGYGVLEYWSCDGTSSPLLTYFVGANAKTTTGSAPVLRIYKQETYAEIKVTMHSLDNVHSITKVIKINNETVYDHDFAVWEPTDDGTNIYVLPDHFTVSGVDYDIIKGDYFVAKVSFAPYSSGTAVVSPSGDPSAQGWYERKGNGTGAKPYYWQKTTDTSVVVGKTYGTIGAGNQKFEAGYAYMYSGSSWDGFDITDKASARKAANLLDDLVTGNVQIPESASNFSMWKWAKNFAAQNAIINNLFSQAITILSSGHIKGGDRYDASGTIVDWSKDGFWFGANGKLMASLQSDPNGNTFVGTKVGQKSHSSPGLFNTAIGYQALYENVTNGNLNVAIGYMALYANTAGDSNVAIGTYALVSNTTGEKNIAIGANALFDNNADYNIAIGANSMRSNTSGIGNIAIGKDALQVNKIGVYNTALGLSALTNTINNYNTALGALTLQNNTSGAYNLAVGSSALSSVTKGGHNVGIGGWGADVYSATGHYQINLNDSIICLEFNAARQSKNLYSVLNSYFPSNKSVGAMGIFNGQSVTGLQKSSSGISVIGPNGYSIATLTGSSTETFTGRTIIAFINPNLTDSDRSSNDCLST